MRDNLYFDSNFSNYHMHLAQVNLIFDADCAKIHDHGV